MGKNYYASSLFPFNKLFTLGTVLVIVGVILIGFGIVDVIYTHLKYVGDNCAVETYATWSCPTKPCDSPSLPLGLSVPGIWCGSLMAIAGAVCVSVIYASVRTLRIKRDVTAAFAGALSLPVAPIAFLLCIFRLYYMNGSFFCMNQDKLAVTDYVQFVMPILTLAALAVGWCLSIAILVRLIQGGVLLERDEGPAPHPPNNSYMYGTNKADERHYRPFVQPSFAHDSAWRDRSADYYDSYFSGKGYPYGTSLPTNNSYLNYSYPGRIPTRNYYS